MTVQMLPLQPGAFRDTQVIPTSSSGVVWSISSPDVLRVCVCPQPALMIVGKLTWAIVICTEQHVGAYHFTAGGRQAARDTGWADAQREGGKLPHSTSL